MRKDQSEREANPTIMEGRILIKRLLAEVMSSCGIMSVIERLYCFRKAFLLMYHRVIDPDNPQPFICQSGMFVTKDTFNNQVRFLKDHFDLVFLDDLIKKRVKGKDISKCCSITFDDGWRDNYTVAFPILEKYSAPATIFLATGFVGSDRIFWPDELSFYLENIPVSKLLSEPTTEATKGFVNKISKRIEKGPEYIKEYAIEALKLDSIAEREDILKYLRSMTGDKRIPAQIMNWNEARKMIESGLVRFGAHTVNHVLLHQVSTDILGKEINASRDDIQTHLGCKINLFAYPNGNFDNDTEKFLLDNGFIGAVTTQRGCFDQNTSLMRIPRIGMHEDMSSTLPMFRNRIFLGKL
jgi:peptidoglycan/xylan/chitin deacetylase (PgdA/CDA1 family)